MTDVNPDLETCHSPKIGDCRKRSLDSDTEHEPTKRSYLYTESGETQTYHFKTLVPSAAAGAIIGKGGEIIEAVQKEAGARVKMSKSNDFYPGTTERVCLITGTTNAIMTVLDFIMDKIREKPDLTDVKLTHERDRQVKILVPNSTAGMIIGKAGAYIKQIKEESGSYVQISQKAQDVTLPERCITILGDTEKNKIACRLIIAKIMEDPLSGSYLNVSYSDMNGPVASLNPTGSPFAISSQSQSSISSNTTSLNTIGGQGILMAGTATTSPTALSVGNLNLSLNLGHTISGPPGVSPQMLELIKATMRTSGYTEPATTDVCQALVVLSKYGGVHIQHNNTNGTGTTHHHPQSTISSHHFRLAGGQPVSAPIQLNLNAFATGLATNSAHSPATIGAAAVEAAVAAAASAQAGQTLGVGGLMSTATATSGSGSGDTTAATEEKKIEIPEVIVGAILGPSGRSLVDIQLKSGANINISKKGEFSPGTRNRIVTITGPASAITIAQYLIEQKIKDEESKRAAL